MKNPWVIVGIITLVLFGGAIWLSNSSQKENNQDVTVTSHIKGNPEATVTLVEYSDFQCPACSAFQPVLQPLLDTYGDKIKFEYKHFPLPVHQFAQQAALAAEAAGQQGKFFEYHDLLFVNQKEWTTVAVPQVLFVQYAQTLGLDIDTFNRHMKSSVLRDKVRADLTEARTLDLTGTPTFFLNGEKMDINTFEEFVTQVTLAVDPNSFASSTPSSTLPSSQQLKFGL